MPSSSKRRRDEESAFSSQKREKYTTIACNECRKRKIKCSGHRPCRHCESYEVDCTYAENCGDNVPKPNTKAKMTTLERQVSSLMEQMQQLTKSVQQLQSFKNTYTRGDATAQDPMPSVEESPRIIKEPTRSPTQPQFIGPTSSAYNFTMAKSTLRRMGIQSDEFDNNSGPDESALSSRIHSPGPAHLQPCTDMTEPLLSIDRQEIYHALEVYKEEFYPIYPYLPLEEIRKRLPTLLKNLDDKRNLNHMVTDHRDEHSQIEDAKTIGILKMIIASVFVLEARGRTAVAQDLVDSVESEMHTTLKSSKVTIPDLHILTMTSTYYFHCDEPVLAWRRIGNAARMAIEMGLHRQETLEKNFPDACMRGKAIEIFWCIYVLDRRWSFGTGMPFVLHDQDIDPSLPVHHCEPYLRCMVSYGQICSKVWNAVAGFQTSNSISKDTVDYLDFQIQQWLRSIPPVLQLIHPRLGDATRNQSRKLQMLRVLLYIRANHMRIFVHRHNILSPNSIARNLNAARLVVDIAKDTIRVLVHLRETSTVYETQQVAFNYFLVSALSALFLSVCHAPEEFSHSCRIEFYSALGLLSALSAQSSITRRLWKGIRGLRQIAPRLGLSPTKSSATSPSFHVNSFYDEKQQASPGEKQTPAIQKPYTSDEHEIVDPLSSSAPGSKTQHNPSIKEGQLSLFQHSPVSDPTATETLYTATDTLTLPTISDISEIGTDLTTLFEALGHLPSNNHPQQTDKLGSLDVMDTSSIIEGMGCLQDREELSQLFESFL